MPVPVIWRDMIDMALYEEMEKKYLNRSLGAFGRCAEFAITGARVLRLLTGKKDYLAVGGGQIVDCGSGEYILISPTRGERRKAQNLADMKFYHCWIQREQLGSGHCLAMEYVDFTVRYDKATADILKRPYQRENPAPYSWGPAAAYDLPFPASLADNPVLRGRQSGWLWRDPVCVRLLRKYENENDDYFSQMTSQVLHNIADRIENIRKASVSPAHLSLTL